MLPQTVNLFGSFSSGRWLEELQVAHVVRWVSQTIGAKDAVLDSNGALPRASRTGRACECGINLDAASTFLFFPLSFSFCSLFFSRLAMSLRCLKSTPQLVSRDGVLVTLCGTRKTYLVLPRHVPYPKPSRYLVLEGCSFRETMVQKSRAVQTDRCNNPKALQDRPINRRSIRNARICLAEWHPRCEVRGFLTCSVSSDRVARREIVELRTE
jgi:hypothetical protein